MRPVSQLLATRLEIAGTRIPCASIGRFGLLAATLLLPAAQSATGQSSDAKQTAKAVYARSPLSFEPNRGQAADSDVQYMAHGPLYGVTLTGNEAVLTLDAGASGSGSRKIDRIHLELPGANRSAAVTAENPLRGRVNYLIGNDPKQWHTDLPTFGKVRYASVYPGVDLVYYGNQEKLEYDFVVAPNASPENITLHFGGAKNLKLDNNGNLTIQAANGAIAFDKPVIYQEKNGKREPVAGSFRLEADNTIGFTVANYDHQRPLVIDPVLTYASYFGGSTSDTISAVAVNSADDFYMTGTTYSVDMKTSPGAYQQTAVNASGGLAFVFKMGQAGGGGSIYSTFIGGTSGVGGSSGNSIAVDNNGFAVVAGKTTFVDLPTSQSAFQRTNPIGSSANPVGFVMRLNAPANAFVYSTYLGGTHTSPSGDSINGVVLDSSGNAVLTGSTGSSSFPTTVGAYQTVSPNLSLSSSNATTTGFVTSLNAAGTALNYSTYLGGSGQTTLAAVALDSTGSVYVTGSSSPATTGVDYPTTPGAYHPLNTSTTGVSGVVTKLNATGSALTYSTFLGSNGTTPTSITLDATKDAIVGGADLTGGFTTTSGAYQTSWAQGDGFVASLKPDGSALNFGTYLSGAVNGVGVESTGYVDTIGVTSNPAFPVSFNGQQVVFPSAAGSYPASAAFFVRLTPGAASLDYGTFFGGSAYSVGTGLAVDTGNNVFIVGATCGSDVPTSSTAYIVAKPAPACSTNSGLSGFAAKFTFPVPTYSTATVYTGPTGQIQSGTAISLTASEPLQVTNYQVNFFDGNIGIGSVVPVSNVATLPARAFSLGTHTITATYIGDPTFGPSTSAPGTFTVVSALQVTFSPSSLTFPSEPIVGGVGTTSAPMTTTLTNGSSVPLAINGIGTTGDFAEMDNCPGSLPAGASCTVSVTFTPTGTGTRIGSLSVSDSISSVPQTASLTGTGIAPVASLSTTTVSMPDENVGTTSPATAVTLTNTASSGAGSLTIQSIVASGDFAQTNNCGATLAAGASCTINITFTPTFSGTRTGAVTITDNSVNGSPQTISLSGRGVSALSISPTSLTFPSQTQGTTSAAQGVTLSNSSASAISISNIAASGDFAETSNCGTSLAANGGTCTISVTFTPTASGTRAGSLTITDSVAGSPQIVSLSGSTAAANATLAPSSLTFNAQSVGSTSAAQTVTLTNSGSAALSVSSVVVSGDFTQGNNCGTSVAAGASCTISVAFAPTTSGTRVGTLTVTDSAGNSPQTVSLTGAATTPVASFSPTSLTFASQSVGTSSSQQNITLTNSGTGALAISSLVISGDFSETTNCGGSVAAGASCNILVTFTPTTSGTRLGAITVIDNASDSPQSIPLSGTATAAALTVSLSPGSLSFSSQLVGTGSSSQTVTLKNTGSSTVNISALTTSGDFSQTNTCGSSIASGATCTISVTFAPTATGSRSGALTVVDNASGSPQTVSLNGTGIAPGATVSPSSLTFAAQLVGSVSSTQNVTLTNTGTASLSFTSIAIAGDFAQTNTCGTSITPGASCNFSVTFTPTAGGTRTGAITIVDNATGSPQTVTLTGTGIALAPAITFTPSSLTFATQTTGSTSAVQSINLHNTGSSTLTINSITATGDYAVGSQCPATLPANSSCILTVTFTPTTTGTRTGAVVVSSNAAGSPQTVPLTGTGQGVSMVTTAPSGGLTIANPGGSATTQLTVGSSNGLAGTAYVTCSVAYTGTGTAQSIPACSLNPTFVTLAGGVIAAPITLTVSTSAATAMNRLPWAPAGAALASLFLMGWIAPRRRRGVRFLALFLAVVLGGLAGCAGSSGTSTANTTPTPATTLGTYKVTVTAAIGGTNATVVIPVTVN